MNLKHILLLDTDLEGWQYGVQRALEEEIIKQTNAEVVPIPTQRLEKGWPRVQHGRKLDFARKLLKTSSFKPQADVAWLVLMGPFDYNLDLFTDWYAGIKYRIVYIFDTLEPTEKALKSVFSGDAFNILITSFNDAVSYMEKITGKKWYSIEQAAPNAFFEPVPDDQKVIPFSSYGRRHEGFHQVLMEFAAANRLYYDFSTHDGSHTVQYNPHMYKQYAWHTAHSVFNICWPVEVTSPRRAGKFHPITCRWFEVASAGTCILGKKPANDYFEQCLHKDLVVEVNPLKEKRALMKDIEKIWENRSDYMQRARQIRAENIHRWTWTNRVERMLDLLDSKKL